MCLHLASIVQRHNVYMKCLIGTFWWIRIVCSGWGLCVDTLHRPAFCLLTVISSQPGEMSQLVEVLVAQRKLVGGWKQLWGCCELRCRGRIETAKFLLFFHCLSQLRADSCRTCFCCTKFNAHSSNFSLFPDCTPALSSTDNVSSSPYWKHTAMYTIL